MKLCETKSIHAKLFARTANSKIKNLLYDFGEKYPVVPPGHFSPKSSGPLLFLHFLVPGVELERMDARDG